MSLKAVIAYVQVNLFTTLTIGFQIRDRVFLIKICIFVLLFPVFFDFIMYTLQFIILFGFLALVHSSLCFQITLSSLFIL